jgi:hypothetical protein
MPKHTPQTIAEDLGRFGLQCPAKLLVFLQSPKGRAMVGILTNKMTQIEALTDARNTKQQLMKIRRHRLILAILLRLIEEAEFKTKELNKHIQEQIEQMINDMRSEESLERKVSSKAPTLTLVDIKLYDEIIHELQSSLTDAQAQYHDIVLELKQLDEALAAIDIRYQECEEFLAGIFPQVASFASHQFAHLIHLTESDATSYATVTSRLLNEGKNVEAQAHQNTTQTLQLKIEMLKQMHLAIDQQYTLYNRDGRRVDTFDQADLYVPRHLQLRQEDGKFYVYDSNKPFELLDNKEKEAALIPSIQNSKIVMMDVRMQLQIRRTNERAPHQERIVDLTQQQRALEQNVQALQHVLTKAKSTRDTMQPSLKQTPRPSPSTKKHASTQAHIASSKQTPQLQPPTPQNPERRMTFEEAKAARKKMSPSPFQITPNRS